jgi:hypothetical protein
VGMFAWFGWRLVGWGISCRDAALDAGGVKHCELVITYAEPLHAGAADRSSGQLTFERHCGSGAGAVIMWGFMGQVS